MVCPGACDVNSITVASADGPASHQSKRGTPTMGGVAIVASIWIGYLVAHLSAGEHVLSLAVGERDRSQPHPSRAVVHLFVGDR